MTQKTSPEGRALIETFEGLFLHPYQDSVGVWTIGYGHTTAAGGPSVGPSTAPITSGEADQLLADDLARVEADVAKCITVPLQQHEFDALVSFDYNTGALRRSSIDDCINAGHKDKAMQVLLMYDHAGGKELAGLTRRRRAEKLLFEGNTQEALNLAGSKYKYQPGTVVVTPKEPPPVAPDFPQATTKPDQPDLSFTKLWDFIKEKL